MSNAPDDRPHVAILGGGSAAFAGAHRALALGARVTICNLGLPMGGTCPNVGCVPSKMLIRAADAFHRARHTGFKGLRLQAELLDFKELVEQKRDLVEHLRLSNYEELVPQLEGLTYIPERARLAGQGLVATASGTLRADHILIATGASPHLPALPGLYQVPYLTNESAFELEQLPTSMVVLGGGYIALECAQMFHRFGSRVTLLQRSPHVLSDQPAYVAEALEGYLRDEGMEVICGVRIDELARHDEGVVIRCRAEGKPVTFTAERLLVAMGRAPNTRDLFAPGAELDLDEQGFIRVDRNLRTSMPHVYAAGDVIGDPQFVYTASYEAETAIHNALTGHPLAADYTALPWVIFTDPQVAGVGLDEEEAGAAGLAVDTATLPATRWPRLKVARDMRGFLKLVRNRKTDQLVGARLVAPEGGDLVTELGMAIRHGITAGELAQTFHPYLTLSEGIQLAAQRFPHSVVG